MTVQDPRVEGGIRTVSRNRPMYLPQCNIAYRFNSANSKYKGTGAGQDAKNRM
ncbi:MAG: hypothetical protein MJY96_05490 [Bacteroidaceae bacterium]|nr:hypothetical protein [Bacteroidaceae bacterium]